jgi:23S rRNA (cytidine1920-2'-O)/16S rRNA (cytidine1409-2'-O)-methyltransferase
VTVGGAPATKPSRLVDPGEPLAVAGAPPRFVSRGGAKLAAALDRFVIPVTGRRALDAGASTGGFTACLLPRGAREVVALDVGTHQLHERLRADPRVVSRERTNLRTVAPGDLGPPFPLVVADLSFISLLTGAEALLAQCAPGADLVLLVKPQFEAGRAEASRERGIITEPRVWLDVLERVTAGLAERRAAIMGAMVSPVRGAEGNVEFLLHAVAPGGRPRPVPPSLDLAAVVAEATGPRHGGDRG